jgi:serine/threonine protein kinase
LNEMQKKMNLYHLDIKPANLLYSLKDKLIKFCDFGVSETIEEKDQKSLLMI